MGGKLKSMYYVYTVEDLHIVFFFRLTVIPDKVEVLDVDGGPVQQVHQAGDRIVATRGGKLSHPHWQETVTCMIDRHR